MIQRIQSLYLLLIAGLSAILFFFPFQVNLTNLSSFESIKLNFGNNGILLLLASAINASILMDGLAALFLYKNRKAQILVCYIISVFSVILGILMYVGSSSIEGMPIYKIPYIIPIVNLILAQIARIQIKKDDNLVKAADRIR